MGIFRVLFEISYITLKLGQCLLYSLYDDLLQSLLSSSTSSNPLGKPLLWFISANNLSKILQKQIVKVEINSIHGNRLDDVDVNSGLGRGTSFCWLQAYENHDKTQTKPLNLFIKIPAADYFKSLFLTMFGVYSNELNFYENIHLLNCVPKDLYPQVYYAKMKRTKFVLILDDILAKNVDFPTILDNCSYERAVLVMKSLARIYAINWNNPPDSIWSTSNRPLFCSIIAYGTLHTIQKRYQSTPLISSEIEQAYCNFIDNYSKIRQHWSSEVLTLVHGDTHLGNMHFYNETTDATGTGTNDTSMKKMGFHDWQCVAQEHGMRDIGYFLLSSLDSEILEENNCELEKKLIEVYITELNSHLMKSKKTSDLLLTYSEAWRLYRELSWWTLTAFVISAGAGDLMPDPMIRTTLQRITRGMKRINAIESLNDMLTSGK